MNPTLLAGVTGAALYIMKTRALISAMLLSFLVTFTIVVFVILGAVADYIDQFYDRTRRHSHLGGTSPEQFEAAHERR